MNRKKTFIILAALVLVMGVLLCGCGKAQEETPADNESDAQSDAEKLEEEAAAMQAKLLEEHTEVIKKFSYALYGSKTVKEVTARSESKHDGTVYTVYSFKNAKNKEIKVQLAEDSAITLDMYFTDMGSDGAEILRKVHFEDDGEVYIGESVTGEKLDEEAFKEFARKIAEAFDERKTTGKNQKLEELYIERTGFVTIKSRQLIQYTVSDGTRIAFDDKLNNVYRAGSGDTDIFVPLTPNEDGSYSPAEE